jgi:nucleoside-diphosphate-sugar epimerase
MNVLVTGGGGFIGSHLVERLHSDGHTVRVLDNFATGRRENLIGMIGAVELVEGDVQSYERASAAVRGIDVVFHQAALPSVPRSVQDPLTSNATNVTGTLNVLLAARDEKVRRVVFASSSSVYGANPELPKREDMATLPIAPYAVAKLAGESYCRSFTHVFGLETVALRYFNVFGPRQDPLSQYAAVVPNFITAALDGTQPVVFGDGEQSRDFTYIDNVVDANVLAATAPKAAGEAFNVGCGDRVSLLDIIGRLESMLGKRIERRHTPARAGDVPHTLADVGKAQRLLGYVPGVGFDEGLRRTVDYFKTASRGGDL